jgi:hypothetical protein
MIAEIVAALVVGIFVLVLVLEPLLRTARRPSPAILDLPDPEDTPRGIALAALKEIEFDRATGKLSDADYTMLKEQYTVAAIQAMRAEDRTPDQGEATTRENGAPDAVEAIIAAKVRALRSAHPSAELKAAVCPGCGPRPEPDALFCSSCGKRLPTGAACAGCRAPLAPGARFCEACGREQRLSA